MRQIYLAGVVLAAAVLWAIPPASAQLSADSGAGINGSPGGGTPQPRTGAAPDFAPPALPGAGSAPGLNTTQSVAKPITGDPTLALFTAVNSGDYGTAQDAVSRGADLNAQNSLGETPLDLSIALNHNSITFMLLAARNESGSGPDNLSPTASATLYQSSKAKPIQAKLVTPIHAVSPAYGNNPGTPNPAAGFLGFGPN